jgi:hypothetical protein
MAEDEVPAPHHRHGSGGPTATSLPSLGDPLIGSSRWRSRLASIEAAAIAGVVCAVGWSIGLTGLLRLPSLDATDDEILRFYSEVDAGRSATVMLQVVVVATIAFLWFVGVVRSRLGDTEPRLFGTVFLGGGVLLAAVMITGTAALAAPSVLVEVGGRPVDPGAAALSRAFAATVLSVFAPRVSALVVLSTASLGRMTKALPRWLVVLSYVIGVGELVNVTFSAPSVYLFPAWIALVSVVLLVRRPPKGFKL